MVAQLSSIVTSKVPHDTNKTAADEVPSVTTYYHPDKLNTIKISCRLYVSLRDCTHQSGCGWCGARNTCIQGNVLGPQESCEAATYAFTTPLQEEKHETIVTEGPLSMTLTTNK
jgi:hypothetical protein